MNSEQILKEAADAVIAHSKETASPVAKIICNTADDGVTNVYMLFSEIGEYAAMEEKNLKDPMISVFIKYLTSHDYPFGDQVQLKFHFGLL